MREKKSYARTSANEERKRNKVRVKKRPAYSLRHINIQNLLRSDKKTPGLHLQHFRPDSEGIKKEGWKPERAHLGRLGMNEVHKPFGDIL